MPRPSTPPTPQEWPVVNPDAAALDIGQAEIWAAVPADRDPQPIRCFATFTPDLVVLADWLEACHIHTVAMESTGVYWIPIYELLESRGFQVYLVNARHLKQVPGRKSDVRDCEWLQRLHSFGLLRGSFRPEAEICVLRAYLRQRAMLIEHRAMHIQHLQKALQQMNVQLTQVLSDITGVTGMAILRAIVAGEHDPQALARLRNPRCSQPETEIAKALTGQYRPEHLFALKQALALYDTYSEQIRECNEEIERQFSALKPERDEQLPPLDTRDKRNTHSKNAPPYDARQLLYQLLGVDLVAVNGLHSSTVETIIAEIGTDMSPWPTVKHFCSWLGLAPRQDVSGGKVVHRHRSKTTNRAGQALRLAAQAVERTQTALGAYFRRMKAKHGPAIAVVATAHKMARIIYALLTHHRPFRDMGAEEYERRERQREIARLEKRAAKLGFKLLSVSA